MNTINSMLNGKKTLLGGIGLALGAIGVFLNQSLADGFQFSDLVSLMEGIGLALTALGLGHKLDKLKDFLGK